MYSPVTVVNRMTCTHTTHKHICMYYIIMYKEMLEVWAKIYTGEFILLTRVTSQYQIHVIEVKDA